MDDFEDYTSKMRLYFINPLGLKKSRLFNRRDMEDQGFRDGDTIPYHRAQGIIAFEQALQIGNQTVDWNDGKDRPWRKKFNDDFPWEKG